MLYLCAMAIKSIVDVEQKGVQINTQLKYNVSLFFTVKYSKSTTFNYETDWREGTQGLACNRTT